MAIKVYQKRGETFYKVRVHVTSSRVPSLRLTEQVSKVRTESEAQKIELRLRKDLERKLQEEEIKRRVSGQTWKGVIDHWYRTQCDIRVKFGSITQSSLEDYYSCAQKWMTEYDGVVCADIRPIDLMETFNRMTEHGLSLAYRRRIRTIIKSIFDHGMQQGLINIPRNPVHDLVLKKGDEKKPEILTIGEIRKLVEVAFAIKHEWRHVWALALLTGMRNGELFALQWSDIDWENKLITVARSFNGRTKEIGTTKAGYWRDVPMSQDCVRLLLELRQERGNEKYILPRLDRWANGIQAAVLRTFCLENALPSVRFHTLRACFGTQLLRQGVPSPVVMKIAGWKDLKTMQRYIRLAGIEVAGATDKLVILPPEEIAANVVAFRPKRD
ncbi:MAG: tyrosine-type recombinase/integrase [Bdellovibrionales bacterium]|nr:tyrosine-type recombinase/integrase [Bdellovibrionales bacterium]